MGVRILQGTETLKAPRPAQAAPAVSAVLPSADLLEILRASPLLLPFNLAIFESCSDGGADTRGKCPLCGVLGKNSLCEKLCHQVVDEALRSAASSNRPAIFRCPTGLLNFAVPFNDPRSGSHCLLGGGVREKSISIAKLEALSNAESHDGNGLLERLEKLPCLSFQEVEGAANEIYKLLPSLLEKNLYALMLDKTTQRIKTTTRVSAELDLAPDTEAALELTADTLVVLFDISRLAILLVNAEDRQLYLARTMGLPEKLQPEVQKAEELLRASPAEGRTELTSRELDALFPGHGSERALLLPLRSGSTSLGMLVLFDAELHDRDLLLVEMLAGKLATRLHQFRQTLAHEQESALTSRLIAMLGNLSLLEKREELYRNIVEMSADLLEATSGSLMLLDETGENLHIEAAKGMNLALARSMSSKVGAGIAGKVARSGFHLLVNDIEKDTRVGIPNRPRFKTKSFISMPLKCRGSVLGVLNLADKAHGKTFNEADLNLLASFAAHAAVLLERQGSLERTRLLEDLSVTDPLTGLYNRRFLEKRLEEELGRSSRQKLTFTVMLIDLDHFKTYNDLCGHLAGDTALKRAATLLRASAREMDIVTRFGGEEFCIVLPGTSIKEAVFVAERIRRAIEQEPFPHEKGLPLGRLTASIGIATFPNDGNTPNSLIHASDIALYQAKNAGRNKIVVYESSMSGRDEDPQHRHG